MKTRPGHPTPLRPREVAGLDPLVDDLPGGQVPPGRHPGRGAEGAAHRAADLRRETDAHRARLVERDQDRLDRQAVAGQEPELLEAVGRRGRRLVERQPGQGADRVARAVAGPGTIAPSSAGRGCPAEDAPR